jgi:hypothetical protein
MLNLDFQDSQAKWSGSKNPVKLLLGVSVLVAALASGSTFASNISLNESRPIEFGQGIVIATSCDEQIILTPRASFVNLNGGGEFRFTSLSVSDISKECDGKNFKIKAYGKDSNSPLSLYQSNGIKTYEEINVHVSAGSYTLVKAGLPFSNISNVAGEFEVELNSSAPVTNVALVPARFVNQITLETSDFIGLEPVVFGDFIELADQEIDPYGTTSAIFSDDHGGIFKITWRDFYKLESSGWSKLSTIPSPVQNQFYGTFGNGVFVVNSFSEIYTSTDGINWIEGSSISNSASTNPWSSESLRFTSAGFLVVGSNRNVEIPNTNWGGFEQEIYQSLDGKNWISTTIVTPRHEEYSQSISFLSFAAGKFVIVGQDFFAYSSNFTDWNFGAFERRLDKTSLTFGNGVWIVTSSSANVLFRSTDGMHWSQSNSPGLRFFYNSIYTGNIFLAFMDQVYSTPLNKFYYSTTGLLNDWREIDSPVESAFFTYVIFDKSTENLIMRSSNGRLFGVPVSSNQN